MDIPQLNLEQKQAILERLGWPPVQARRASEERANAALNALWGHQPMRLEFEVLRQVGHAFEYSEISDLPLG